MPLSGREPDGDEEARAKRVAAQLWSAWKAEDAAAKKGAFSASMPAWAGLVLSLCTIIWGAAILQSDVHENRRRVEIVEANQRTQDTDSRQVIDRLARIEAKLDLRLGKEE